MYALVWWLAVWSVLVVDFAIIFESRFGRKEHLLPTLFLNVLLVQHAAIFCIGLSAPGLDGARLLGFGPGLMAFGWILKERLRASRDSGNMCLVVGTALAFGLFIAVSSWWRDDGDSWPRLATYATVLLPIFMLGTLHEIVVTRFTLGIGVALCLSYALWVALGYQREDYQMVNLQMVFLGAQGYVTVLLVITYWYRQREAG